MFRSLRALLRPYASFDALAVFFGTGLRLAGRLAAFLLVSHWLGREAFGLFGVAIDTAEIADSFADVGSDTASVTFASRHARAGDAPAFVRVFRTALWVKGTVALILLATGWAIAAPLAARLGFPALAPALRIAFLLVPAKELYKLGNNILQARQEFRRLSVFILLPPLLIVLGAVGFRLAGGFTLEVAVGLYAVTQGLAIFLLPGWFPRGLWQPRPPARADVRQMIGFGRWVYLSNLLGTLRLRANTYLLLGFASPAALGDYQYAVRLASLLNLVTETATVTLLPKMTARSGAAEVAGYLRRTLLRLAFLLLPLAGLAFLFRPVLAWLQPEFVGAAPAAAALYLSLLGSVATVPLSSALYALRSPHLETYLELGNLAVLLALGYILVRLLPDPALGAGLALLVQRGLDFFALLFLVRREIRRQRETGA